MFTAEELPEPCAARPVKRPPEHKNWRDLPKDLFAEQMAPFLLPEELDELAQVSRTCYKLVAQDNVWKRYTSSKSDCKESAHVERLALRKSYQTRHDEDVLENNWRTVGTALGGVWPLALSPIVLGSWLIGSLRPTQFARDDFTRDDGNNPAFKYEQIIKEISTFPGFEKSVEILSSGKCNNFGLNAVELLQFALVIGHCARTDIQRIRVLAFLQCLVWALLIGHLIIANFENIDWPLHNHGLTTAGGFLWSAFLIRGIRCDDVYTLGLSILGTISSNGHFLALNKIPLSRFPRVNLAKSATLLTSALWYERAAGFMSEQLNRTILPQKICRVYKGLLGASQALCKRTARYLSRKDTDRIIKNALALKQAS